MRRFDKKKLILSRRYALSLIILLILINITVWFSYAFINLLLARNDLYEGNLTKAYEHFLAVSTTGLFHSRTYLGFEILKILNGNSIENPISFDEAHRDAIEFYNHKRLLENLIKNSKYEIAYRYSRSLISFRPEPGALYYGGIAATAIGRYEEAADLFLSLSEDSFYHIKAEEKLTMLEKMVDESFFSVKDRNGNKIAKSFSELNTNNGSSDHLKNIIPLMQMYENDLYNSVILTIDSRLQKITEETLGEDSGIMITISPQTGDILSIAASGQCLREKFYLKKFQPGFLINIITAIAAQEKNRSDKTLLLDCPGEKKFGDIKIYNNNASKTQIGLSEALESGCNSAFSDLALSVGKEGIEDAAKRMFINSAVKIGGEKIQIASAEIIGNDSHLVRFATGSYNTWTTPIHLALMASAVAAKGPVYRPRLILDKQNIDGGSYYRDKPQLLNITAEESTYEPIMNAFMKTGAKIWKNEPDVQKPGVLYAYSGGLKVSFSWIMIGFYPADNPKIAFSLILVDDSALEENIIKKIRIFISKISDKNIF